MQFDQRVLIAAPIDQVWQLIRDVPTAAACVPGTHDVHATGDNQYQGSVRVQVGPITVDLEGSMALKEEFGSPQA